MEKDLELRVSELEKMLFLSKNVLSFDEASRFLNLSKSYLYKLTSGNLIPHYKPQGKMLYFEKTELEAWLRQNPVKTQAQIEQEAQKYILNRPLKEIMANGKQRRKRKSGQGTAMNERRFCSPLENHSSKGDGHL